MQKQKMIYNNVIIIVYYISKLYIIFKNFYEKQVSKM